MDWFAPSTCCMLTFHSSVYGSCRCGGNAVIVDAVYGGATLIGTLSWLAVKGIVAPVWTVKIRKPRPLYPNAATSFIWMEFERAYPRRNSLVTRTIRNVRKTG